MKKNLYLLALFFLPTLVFFSLSRLWQEAETPSETPPVPSQAPQHREGPKDRNSGPGAPVAPEKRYKGLPGAAMLEKREASVATAAQLEVTVIDEETGAPIPGVKVAILDWATRAEQMSEETNLEGRASLQLGTGQYWLTADHPDYLSGETGVSMDPAKARIGKTLALKGVSRVTGTLRNQNGVAVADARILFRRGGNPLEKGSHLSTNTRRDGSFELSATPGTYEVQVVKLPSEKILESPVVVPTAGPLKLTLEEEANPVRLFGRVVGEDGAPVEDANVTVKLRSRSFPRLVGQSKTNGRGRFEMQAQQTLAQSGHGAGVVFVLIMSGVERIEHEDLGLCRAGGGQKMIQTVVSAQEMPGGAGIHPEIVIGGRAERLAHLSQSSRKGLQGKLELTEQDPSRSGNVKAGSGRAGRQGQGQVGDQQGLAHLGLTAHEENPLSRQQGGPDQGRIGGGIPAHQLGEGQDRLGRGAHSKTSGAASRTRASPT